MGLKVVHRHRAGRFVFARVSELVFVNGRPRAVLGWLNLGGVRTPIYICELDPGKLRQAAHAPRSTYYYDDVTIDPRYEPVDEQKGVRTIFPADAAHHVRGVAYRKIVLTPFRAT